MKVKLRDKLAGLFRSNAAADLDQAVLSHLKKAGSDLSKEHEIDFFLYFPTEPTARQIALNLESEGFHVQVDRAPAGSTWLCYARRRMVPDLMLLKKIRADFNEIATSLGGTYDGWGTEVQH